MRVTAYMVVGILLLSPTRARADERSFGNRLPYWTPPVHKELPKTWGWGGFVNKDIDQYDLNRAIYLPGSQRIISVIMKRRYEKGRQIDGADPTLLERDFNIPPLSELLAEVKKIKQIQAKCEAVQASNVKGSVA